jgi:hypothetical protein
MAWGSCCFEESTYHIGSAVLLRKNVTGIGGGHDEVRDNGNGLDLWGPVELSVVTDSKRGLGGLHSSVNATGGRGQDLTKRNLFPGNILGLQLVQICTHKTSEQRGSHVIGVSLYRMR